MLQLFHVVVNRTNVDYVAILWWDFFNCVFQKKDVIQYPCFTKLIIVDLMMKYPSIPQRLDEDYYSIKDDIPLVSVYSTGNVLFRGMLILDAFLTDEIRATDDYKEYETVFVGVEGKKRKQSVRETSSPRKSLKVAIRQKKQSTTPIPPPGDDRERDEMAEATLLSLTLYKTALATKAQENIAKVQEKLKEEEIEKMVEGEKDEESYASELADSMFNDDDDSGTRIEPKTNDVAEEKDNDDHIDHTLVGTHATGSMKTRNEQMQTPIPTPNRSLRKDLSSDKKISKELTVNGSPTVATTSKSKSKRRFTSNMTKILPGSIAGIVVLEMTFAKTNEMIKEEMPGLVHLAVNKDREIAPINIDLKKIIAYSSVAHMNLIVKFCDATLERVLNGVKLRIFQNQFWKKPSLLGELDIDIMKAFEREITKRLRHHEHVRRWESFVNRRPILPTLKRLY
ncbi:hypothetical protein Tco_0285069 [Tanacetum coccineum]